MRVKSRDNSLEGDLFYTAYFAKDPAPRRPITFCFNGGPGSSSVWLHIGAFGPKRVVFPEKVYENIGMPRLEDNPESLFEISDLVFIDPVPTGYSRAVPAEKEKQFFGFQEDVSVMGDFIRCFLTQYGAWDRPKVLAGESYGGTRAVALAIELQNKHFIQVDGLVLIAPALDFATFSESGKTHLLPYLNYLPTYAAIAHFHKKAFAGKNLNEATEEAERVAFDTLAPLLLRGEPHYTKEKIHHIQNQLQSVTGLKPDVFRLYEFQVGPLEFAKELLSDQNKIVGRFDGRFVGSAWMPAMPQVFYDPSLEAIAGTFTKYINDYFKKELKVEYNEEYRILLTLRPWSFGDKAQNQFLTVQPAFEEILVKNPRLQVYLASGYYDLAIPFGANKYFFSHLTIPGDRKARFQHHIYRAGHMMYLEESCLKEMKSDLANFYQQAIPDEPSSTDPQVHQTSQKKGA